KALLTFDGSTRNQYTDIPIHHGLILSFNGKINSIRMYKKK
ncbi:35138_t:CDS:1, partial [Racocetra persica]